MEKNFIFVLFTKYIKGLFADIAGIARKCAEYTGLVLNVTTNLFNVSLP
jgi:hypothetical protein